MSASLPLATRIFPSRIADLGFSARLPADWPALTLPEEAPDFSNPTLLVPLALVMAPHAALIFSFAARPAYEDGTLFDWAQYLLNHNQLKPRAMGTDAVGGIPAVIGEATQDSEVGPLLVRFAFLEDGGRLINLTLTAPEMLAGTVQGAWFEMLGSFALESPKNPAARRSADRGAESAETAPAPATPRPVAPEPVPVVTAAAPAEPSGLVPFDAWKAHALAEDAATLDPEHPINANLRDRGIGLVPRVVASSDTFRKASLASGALVAQIDVPYGWHVLDDGKRLLVLDPSSEVQLHLHRLPREGRSNARVLDEIEEQTRKDYPGPEFARRKQGRIHVLAVRNIADGDQALEQSHFLFPGRTPEMLLRARVTAIPERAVAACHLAELMLESLAFDYEYAPEPAAPEPAATEAAAPEPRNAGPSDGLPAWWHQALALEGSDRLPEAERLIKDSVPNLHFAAVTADLYRQRMLRLKEAGDALGAESAYRKADDWIGFYASQATSGGEGTALSQERDAFRAELIQQFGGRTGK